MEQLISIHAPTRGATRSSFPSSFISCISIHAPTRGATNSLFYWRYKHEFQSTLPREERRYKHIHKGCLLDFNPRSHERSDTSWELYRTIGRTFQSTLPREERRNGTVKISNAALFQSTLPREERQRNRLDDHFMEQFQSTLPREERRAKATNVQQVLNFNPRSHERSDSNIAQKICLFLYNTDNKYIIR